MRILQFFLMVWIHVKKVTWSGQKRHFLQNPKSKQSQDVDFERTYFINGIQFRPSRLAVPAWCSTVTYRAVVQTYGFAKKFSQITVFLFINNPKVKKHWIAQVWSFKNISNPYSDKENISVIIFNLLSFISQ